MSDAHDEPTANRLADETSAYLRQHMHNPVDWRPWGPEALAAAEDAGKPLLVSIGYSACHWCHVMERESFEDPETAALMNRLFVSVKVDREERPDVDQVYMDTVVRLTGSGGWPLTVFCTPDGRPFYGGTYFPPEPRHGMPSFRQVLEAVHDAWEHRRDEVDVSARRILDALRAEPRAGAAAAPGIETLCSAAIQLLRSADPERGGFGGAPKFPTPTNLETLLAAADHLPARKADEALEHVRLTCREMAGRGLYDQLAGGFHRYCVDDHWGVPHFEKMLYDQGQLLRVYAETWRRSSGDDAFAWPAEETAAWLRREMRGPEGAFFASVDADSEGEEGRYYVWTPDEVREVLGAERAAAFCDAYGVHAPGSFEGRSVLWDVAREPRNRFAEERQALREARAGRVPPDTDRKRIAAWNGMTISGLALAGSLFDSPALVKDAVRSADFVLAEMVDDRGRLLRVWNQGAARIPAFLDDHAALLAALLDLHRAGAGERYLLEAGHLAAQIADRFYDPGESDLFLTPVDGERLVHRPRSDHDGATPHSAGLAVLGLLRTATLTGDDELRAVAERVTARHAPYLERVPAAFPTLARAAAWIQEGLGVALIVGAPEAAETRALALRARRALRPDEAVVVAAPERAPKGLDPAWLRGREAREGRATAYVCRGATCSLPITEPEAFAEALAGAPAAG